MKHWRTFILWLKQETGLYSITEGQAEANLSPILHPERDDFDAAILSVKTKQ